MSKRNFLLFALLASSFCLHAKELEVELVDEGGSFIATHTLDDSEFQAGENSIVTLPVAGDRLEAFQLTARRRSAHAMAVDRQTGEFVSEERSALVLTGESGTGWKLRGVFGGGQLNLELSSDSQLRYVSTAGVPVRQFFEALSRADNPAFSETIIGASPSLPGPNPGANSLVDPFTGMMVLRHVGMFFTITENLWKFLDPLSDGFSKSVPVDNFMIGLSAWVDDALTANAGVTINGIGAGTGADRPLAYIFAPNAGYTGQPPQSVFNNLPLLKEDWAIANQVFQDWIVSNAGAPWPAWWDAGIVLGLEPLDPMGGSAALGAVCSAFYKATAYVSLNPASIVEGKVTNNWGNASFHVVHEIGHLLGAHHTFSSQMGGCAGNAAAGHDLEIGGGRTFMSYPFLCGTDDDIKGGMPFFHADSLSLIDTQLTALENGAPQSPQNCIGHQVTANDPVKAIITAPAAPRWVPRYAGFTLTAYASDADAYSENPNSFFAPPGGFTGCGSTLGVAEWNQMDALSAGGLPPLFRAEYKRCPQGFGMSTIAPPASYVSKSFGRFFPPYNTGLPFDVGTSSAGELHFRATVWDINASNGDVPSYDSADVTIAVKPESVPTVSSPLAGAQVQGGQKHTIKWSPNPSTLATPKFSSIAVALCTPSKGKCQRLATQYGAPGVTNAMEISVPSTGAAYDAYFVITYDVDAVLDWHVFSDTFQVVP